jgi:putative copper resistance protein D
MGDAVNPWLHILAATIWVGPQVFLFAVAVPAVRTVADVKERARLIRLITTRFGYLAWGAMAVLVVTGIGNLFENDRSIHYLFNHHFGTIFQVKMTLVVATIILTAVHSFVIGPRMLALQESVTDQSQIASMRRASIIISSINGVLALGILFCAALLNTDFALR